MSRAVTAAGHAELSGVDRERNREAWNLPRQPATTNGQASAVPAGLDWQAFLARRFPGRQRHDLEALTAYGAYRSSRGVPEGGSHARDH
jgi:hypothetical protein